MKYSMLGLAALAAAAQPSVAWAQGQDSTRAERDAQIILSLLPGRYDNFNQTYFARRLGDPDAERQARRHVEIERIDGTKALSILVKALDAEGAPTGEARFEATLHPEPDGRHVRMKFYRGNGRDAGMALAGCDLLWSLEASQYRAKRADKDCVSDPDWLPTELQLGESDLWWQASDRSARSFELERARTFSCYIDVPGVGGGRDIPYRRYEIADIHDKGDVRWVELEDGSAMSVKLTNVRWPMNNLDGIFTRHSFVVYLGERRDGDEREIAYGWTQPDAQRIGINIKTALVNCFMLNNEEIEPFFRDEPKL